MHKQHKFFSGVLFLAFVFSGGFANATIKIDSVSGASNFTLPTATTTSPTASPAPTTGLGTTTIYGGSAGVDNSYGSPTAPFNTCVKDPSARKACNPSAINGSVLLTITFTPTKEGTPGLFPPATQTTSPIDPVTVPVKVAANQTTSLTYRWADICARMASTVALTDCVVPDATKVTQTFTLSVRNDDGSVADSANVDVVLRTFIGQGVNPGESETGPRSTTDVGLNQFEIGNGDGKVVLRNLEGTQIPNGTGLQFKAVRLFWVEVASDTNRNDFDLINSATPTFSDLPLTVGTAGEIKLTPARVTGFENDKIYALKIALIDLANNIGHYTSRVADIDCSFTATPASQTCHYGKPGAVVGVLSSDLNCFVATAAYGSIMAPQVKTFRSFRDGVLRQTSFGKKFVAFYYKHSPKYASVIARNETLRSAARGLLWPVLAFAQLSLKYGVVAAFAMIGAAAATVFVLAYAFISAVSRVKRRGSHA